MCRGDPFGGTASKGGAVRSRPREAPGPRPVSPLAAHNLLVPSRHTNLVPVTVGEVPIPLVERMREFGTTIFAEMSAVAVATGSINLGQGFPDTDGPGVVLEAAVEAIRSGKHNQYPPRSEERRVGKEGTWR